MTVTTSSPSLLEAALGYARRGWPVFPCNDRNGRPLLARDRDADGKTIPNSGGVTKASCDEKQIRAWWSKWPRANIGVSVGRGGVLVIDFDPRVDVWTEEGADEETGEVVTIERREEWTLDRLKAALEEQMGCPLPVSLASITPSGGVHVWLAMPAGEPIGNRGNLPHHVDVRGLGGYVIAPPCHRIGDLAEGGTKGPGQYRWLRGDDTAPIADAPEALVAILRAGGSGRPAATSYPSATTRFVPDLDEAHRRYAINALDRELAELAQTPKGGGRHGGRNAGVYHAAFSMGQLVGAGALSEALVRHALLDVVRGFDPHAYATHATAVDNGLTNGIAKPRDLSAIGAQATRGRGSARSSSYPPDEPPLDVYAGDVGNGHPGPPDGGLEAEGFQSGTAAFANSNGGSGGRIVVPRDTAMDLDCARLATTDLGNAERFMAREGWRFRFCPEIGWYAWDGRRWELLSEEKDKVPGRVSLAVFHVIRAIRHEADAVEASGLIEDLPPNASEDDRAGRLDRIVRWKGAGDTKLPVYYSETLRDHAKSSEGAQRLSAVANLVKSFTAMAIRADAMDADRMAINLRNGTLRLTQAGKRWCIVDGAMTRVSDGDRWGVRLDKHRPDDLISKVAGVEFVPAAKSGAYDAFLATVQPDEGTRRFLHQWGGVSLTGDIGEQKLAFFHGKGRNGKSTLVDLWSIIAGDYGGSVGIETFLDQGRGRKGGDATPDLARLPGIRFLRTSEPEKGAKLAEALIKLITGGELIDARFLNKGFFSFLPSFKVTISGNHKPKITGHDDGIWRRVMLVPWDVQIAVEDVDKALPDKLRSEASGVLNRLIAGLLDWRVAGLIEPASVLAATAKYREQSDQLGRFLAECTRPEDGARAKSSELFALFIAWAKANGAAEWQQVGFTKAMEDRGFENKRSNGIQWLGIEMVKSVHDYADAIAAGDDPGPDWDDIP